MIELLNTLDLLFEGGEVLHDEELNLIVSHINDVVGRINSTIIPAIENIHDGRDGRDGQDGRDGLSGLEGISSLNAFVGAGDAAEALLKLGNRSLTVYPPGQYSISSNVLINPGEVLFMTSARRRGENDWLFGEDNYIWSIPVLLGVGNTTSTTGVDTDELNYIYCRTFRDIDAAYTSQASLLSIIMNYIEEHPGSGVKVVNNQLSYVIDLDNDTDANINGAWTDHPYGIDETFPHEWMVGYKKNELDLWEYYFGPIMISNYGFNGLDGDGYEYIFARNDTKNSAPSIDYTANNNKTREDDDFIPLGWTDEPLGVSDNIGCHYEWVATRKKFGNPAVWHNFSVPSIWGLYAAPGKLGLYRQWAYKNAVSIESDEIPESNNVYPPNGWTSTASTPDFANGEYTWCIDRTVTFDANNQPVYGNWSNPAYRITGDDGLPGTDGKYTEFIYKRSDTPLTFGDDLNNPHNWTSNSAQDSNGKSFNNPDYTGPSTAGWTDNPQGIDPDHKYEYMSQRKFNGTSFESFIVPKIWAKWGEKGEDGDGVEYIFYASSYANSTEALTGDLYPPNWTSDINFLNPNYIKTGSGWSADPIDLNGSGLGLGSVEWVSVRRKTNNTWAGYSIPVVWTRLAKDGVAEGYTVDFTNENMPVATSVTGDVPSYTNSGTILVYYNGIPLSYDANAGSGHFSYSIGTITRSDGNTVNSTAGATSEKIIATPNGAGISISMTNVSSFDTKNAYIPVTVTLPNGSTNSFNITLFGVPAGLAGEPGDAIDLFLDSGAVKTDYNLTTTTPSTLKVGVKIGKTIYYSNAVNNSAESLGYSFKYYYDNLSSNPSNVPNTGSITLAANGGTDTPLQSITVIMYYTPSGGSTVLVDLERIPYIRDGKKGDDGDSIVSVTKTYLRSSLDTPETGRPFPSDILTWLNSSPPLTEQEPYLWAKEYIEFTNASKNTTNYYYIGSRGDNGIDAQDVEWVYVRTTNNVAPLIVASSGEDYWKVDDFKPLAQVSSGNIIGYDNTSKGEGVSTQCTDDPKGVNETWKYEWEIKRTKGSAVNGHREWNNYTPGSYMTLRNNYAESAFIIDLDNDNDLFGTDSNSDVILELTRSTHVRLYDGATAQTLNTDNAQVPGVSAVLKYIDDDTTVPPAIASVLCQRDTSDNTTGNIIIIFHNLDTNNNTINFAKSGLYAEITATDINNRSKQTIFTIRKVMSGLPGLSPIIYQLSPTLKVFSFYRNVSNDLLPASLSSLINVARTEGNTTTLLSTALTGITYSWGFDDSSTAQESNKAIGTSITVSNSDANNPHYLVWVELSTGDKETLPIAKDGTNGTNGLDASEINPNILLRTLFKSISSILEKWQGTFTTLNEYYTPTPDGERVNGYNIIRSELSNSDYVDIFQSVALESDTWYTFSFWLRQTAISLLNNLAPILSVYMSYDSSSSSGGTPGCVSEYYVDNGSIQTLNDGGTEFSGGTWNPTKHTIRFKTVSDISLTSNGSIRFRFRGGVNVISMPKLEIGLVATAYVANEADLEGKHSSYEEKLYANYDSDSVDVNGVPAGSIQGSWSTSIPATSTSYPYLWERVRQRTYDANNQLVALAANAGWTYGLLTKPGAPGQAGSAGRMYYPAGEYDNTIEYTRDNNVCPVVHYTDLNVIDTGYWYLNADTNVVNNVHIAPSSSGNDNPWQRAVNYGMVITEALFAQFAKLGSFVVSGDFFISQHGILFNDSGEVGVTSSRTVGSVYTLNNTPYLALSTGDIACYTYFDSSDPMVENSPASNCYKFKPVRVINAKTGEEWSASGNIHMSLDGSVDVKGDIIANTLTAGDTSGLHIITTGGEILFISNNKVVGKFVTENNGMLMYIMGPNDDLYKVNFTNWTNTLTSGTTDSLKLYTITQNNVIAQPLTLYYNLPEQGNPTVYYTNQLGTNEANIAKSAAYCRLITGGIPVVLFFHTTYGDANVYTNATEYKEVYFVNGVMQNGDNKYLIFEYNNHNYCVVGSNNLTMYINVDNLYSIGNYPNSTLRSTSGGYITNIESPAYSAGYYSTKYAFTGKVSGLGIVTNHTMSLDTYE